MPRHLKPQPKPLELRDLDPDELIPVTLTAAQIDALLGMAARTTVTLAMFDPDPQKGAALDEQWESAHAVYRACKTLYAALPAPQQEEG